MVLETALKKYVSDTFGYIRTVKGFVDMSPNWEMDRQADVDEIIRIKKDEDDDSDEKDLADLTVLFKKLRETGLREMEEFLDAVEKLSVTSVHMFQNNNSGFRLTGSADLTTVCSIIETAQILSPMLILFKRNNEAFFQPNLDNMEVQHNQLKKYLETVKRICEVWRESSVLGQRLNEPVVEVHGNPSESDMENIMFFINTIDQIRMDELFRMISLFQGKEHNFMKTMEKLEPEMRTFLDELEACADELESMCKGSHVTGVVSGSVSIVGGILTILGIIFAPITAGGSLALTAAGATMAVTSGVTGLVTSATTIGVNETQAQKAKDNFQQFVKASSEIQCCVDDVIQEHFDDLHNSSKAKGAYMLIQVERLTLKLLTIPGLYKNIKAFAATGSLAVQAAGEGMTVMSKVGQTLSKMSGTLSVFFLGVDIYNVVYHSKHLQGGCEPQTSKWIRARVTLWRLEVDSWRKMYDYLLKAQDSSVAWKKMLKHPIRV